MTAKTKPDYSTVDAAILAHIEAQALAGQWTHPIYAQTVTQTARNALQIAPDTKTDDDWRLIDRRIQALRKAGRIERAGRGWRLKS